jgi:hypothetical protein
LTAKLGCPSRGMCYRPLSPIARLDNLVTALSFTRSHEQCGIAPSPIKLFSLWSGMYSKSALRPGFFTQPTNDKSKLIFQELDSITQRRSQAPLSCAPPTMETKKTSKTVKLIHRRSASCKHSCSCPATNDGSKKPAKGRDLIQPQTVGIRCCLTCASWHAGRFTLGQFFRPNPRSEFPGLVSHGSLRRRTNRSRE